MEVTLIYPCYRFSRSAGVQEPLGLLYIASMLKSTGHKVNVFDLTFADDLNSLADSAAKSDVAGIYVSTPMFDLALEMLDLCKRRNPVIITVAGGPHPTFAPDQMLKAGFDYAVLGEGETSMTTLVTRLSEGVKKPPPGVVSKDIPENERAPFIGKLDDLPPPAREMIDQDRYVSYNGYLSVIATRGCPYSCIYCKPTQELLFGRKIRKRSPAGLIEEIAGAVRDYRCDTIYFKDDVLLSTGKKWMAEFVSERKRRGLNFKWMALARVDQIDEESLRLYKQGGLYALAFGVESGSQRILDYYQKGITIEQTGKAFDLCNRLGILTHAYFMVGAPDETYSEGMQSVNLARRLRPHSVRIMSTTPIPGNLLYDQAKAEGRLLPGLAKRFYSNSVNNAEGILPMRLSHLTARDVQSITSKIRRAVLVGNLKRVVTNPGQIIHAAANWRKVWHLVANRL